MTQQEAAARLGQIIFDDFTHKYYDRNIALYQEYLALSTGEGIDRYLQRFSSRESKAAFDERLRVTVDICKAIVKNLCHVFYRVTRSAGIRIDIQIEDTKKEDHADILKSYGRWGLNGYMEKRFTDFSKIDPNGWLVVDFEGTDGTEYAKPYPVEYYSPDVIDYRYNLNVLEYLCVKQDVEKSDGEGVKGYVSDYTIYTQEGAVKFVRHPEIETAPMWSPETEYEDGMTVGFNEREIEVGKDAMGRPELKTIMDVYEVVIPTAYDLDETPAAPIGYLPDEGTRGETFVNFFDNAVPFLKKLIKVNSESDISACKHAFPQRIQFVKNCPNECEQSPSGEYVKDGHCCPVCDGNGMIDAHRSGLDVIYLPITDETKDLNLDNIVKYVAVPIDTLQYQDDRIQALVEMCKRVIYNTDIFSKQEISDTATAKLIEMENMYDTIYTYAVHYGQMYGWQLDMISDITSIEGKVDVMVSKDFKLLSKAQLIEMLQAAMNAGANPAIINAINDELAYSFFGNTQKFSEYLEAKRLIPFGDKTAEQQSIILSTLEPDNRYRLAFQFGQEILKELVAENEGFFLMNDMVKRQMFNDKLDLIVVGMEVEEPRVPGLNELPEVEEDQE